MQERRTQQHRHDRQQVAHGGRVGRTLVLDEPVVDDERDTGAEDTQDAQRQQRAQAQVHLLETADRHDERGQTGADHELARGQLQRRQALAGQRAADVDVGHGVARGGREAGQRAPARQPGPLPRREDQQGAREAQRQPRRPRGAALLLEAEQQAQSERPQRRGRVDHARHPRVDGPLADREQHERDHVAEERRDRQVPPRARGARQPVAAGVDQHDDHGGAERGAAHRDLDGGEAGQRDLDPQEARAPDEREDTEPDQRAGFVHGSTMG